MTDRNNSGRLTRALDIFSSASYDREEMDRAVRLLVEEGVNVQGLAEAISRVGTRSELPTDGEDTVVVTEGGDEFTSVPRPPGRPLPEPEPEFGVRILPDYDEEQPGSDGEIAEFEDITGKVIRGVMGGGVVELSVSIFNYKDPESQMRAAEGDMVGLISDGLEDVDGFKVAQTMTVKFRKLEAPEMQSSYEIRYIERVAYFRTKAEVVVNIGQAANVIDELSRQIVERIGTWISQGSGWTISRILVHSITLYKYDPLADQMGTSVSGRRRRARLELPTTTPNTGLSGSSYLELPASLRNSKKGLINLQNMNDNMCFMWCHVRMKRPVERNPSRITKEDKVFANTLKYDNIKFPVELKSIPKIETQNNIRVNVFGHDRGKFFPLYLGKSRESKILNLLLVSDDQGNGHYVFIKSVDSLFCNTTRFRGRKYFCHYCIVGFSSERVLANHVKECLVLNGAQAVKLPEEGTNIVFKNHRNELPVPFVIYADFEAILEPSAPDVTEVNQDGTHTEKYESHKCCGFAYKVVCCYDDKLSKPCVVYRGEDSVRIFLKAMMDEEKWCYRMYRKHFNKLMCMTSEDKKSFALQKECHICKGPFVADDRVRDHCHFTGKYRGAAHRSCNANYSLRDIIPVVFHNLRGYDSHFLVLGMSEFKRRINIIPNNYERYMTIGWGKLKFIDSFQFMSAPLDRLVSNLPAGSFVCTDKEFEGPNLDLVKRKGVYPYDYFDSMERFEETELPAKEGFYSKLNESGVSDSDYEHAKLVWDSFSMETLGDYHDLYLRTDTVLLADVFEEFRRVCQKNYGLDPAHYLSSPGLSWDAMLKYSGVSLELISDIDQYQMVEKGMRGGVSCISHRHAAANNPMVENYDEDKPTDWLMYLDANNLYGWAMSRPLPVGGFRFLDEEEINTLDIYNPAPGIGYYLEVDLEIPEELHGFMAGYPVAPEKLVITDEMLSPYCKDLKDKLRCMSGGTDKLVTTLLSKTKYVLHYKNLQLYISLGAVLTKIHRALEFKQESFLKGYIDMNTKSRMKAANAFEKDFYKLMNNSVYGKTCENLRKRVDIKLVNNEATLRKMISKPTFIGVKEFSENLVAVRRIKKSLFLNKPSYVGCAVLELSKCLMYEFHYNWILKKYGPSNAKLLFTDTDSLTYLIKTENIYEDMWAEKDGFDFSDYSKDSPYYSAENKKVIGKMKDECAGKVMSEFVGLRAKMYSFTLADKGGTKKAKGVKKGVLKKHITHQDYLETLNNEVTMQHKQRSIRSDKHVISTVEVSKVSLSCFDDKRYILDDGVTSLPYGHYMIGSNQPVPGQLSKRVTMSKGPQTTPYPMAMHKYRTAVLESPKEELYIEHINPKVLQCVLDNWDVISEMGDKKREKHESDYMKRILTIISRVSVGGFFLVRYYETACGRVYPIEGVSLQMCWRVIRQVLSVGLYTDVDMVNAHPTLLLNMAEESNIDLPFMRQYVENREGLIKSVQESNSKLSRDDVKRNTLAVLNGGKSTYVSQFEDQTFIRGFADDAKRMRKHFAPDADFKEKKRQMSYAMTRRENKLLQECVQLAKEMGIDVMVLIYDGFQIPNTSDSKELVNRINKLDKRIKFKEKGFDECDGMVAFLKEKGCKFGKRFPKSIPSRDRLLASLQKKIPSKLIF